MFYNVKTDKRFDLCIYATIITCVQMTYNLLIIVCFITVIGYGDITAYPC